MGAEKIEFVTVSVEQLRTLLRAEIDDALKHRDDDVLLTNEQAASMLGITPSALLKRVAAGKLTPDKRTSDSSKGNRYRRETIEAARSRR